MRVDKDFRIEKLRAEMRSSANYCIETERSLTPEDTLMVCAAKSVLVILDALEAAPKDVLEKALDAVQSIGDCPEGITGQAGWDLALIRAEQAILSLIEAKETNSDLSVLGGVPDAPPEGKQ